jgi:transposase-like protein
VLNRGANRARMEQLIERWRASGQSLSAFSRKHGISRDKLEYWTRRLAAGDGADQAVELATVRLIDPIPTEDGRLEIVLETGDRVLVPRDTPVERVREVVGVLRGC